MIIIIISPNTKRKPMLQIFIFARFVVFSRSFSTWNSALTLVIKGCQCAFCALGQGLSVPS